MEEIIHCENCNKLLTEEQIKIAHRYERKHFFCSVSCERKSRKTGINVKCETCKKDVYIRESRINNSGIYFCSKDCSNKCIKTSKVFTLNGIKVTESAIKKIADCDWELVQKLYNENKSSKIIISECKISRKIFDLGAKLKMFNKYKREFKHTEETKRIISNKMTDYFKGNIKFHNWHLYRGKSIPCEKLKDILKANNISFVPEFQALDNRCFSIDIAFPDVKVGIEVNGNQHYNKDCTLAAYYQERHDLIEKDGWKLIELHFSVVYDNNKVNKLIASLKNDYSLSNIDYSLEFIPINFI